ncbi:HNH endonuclease [Reyranella soli]|uniref:HNH domain-containing protein n=1 Tax=Reyranella soli TaxID=1230389 RepID=A0A512NQY1_9HYPH|nr:hypothetical protein RSO01_85240 [Reyranella soli]
MPYCGEPMMGPDRWPSWDHIKPKSKRYKLTADNRAIVCSPCNKAKGSLSLHTFYNRLVRTGDRRAPHVERFMQYKLGQQDCLVSVVGPFRFRHQAQPGAAFTSR